MRGGFRASLGALACLVCLHGSLSVAPGTTPAPQAPAPIADAGESAGALALLLPKRTRLIINYKRVALA